MKKYILALIVGVIAFACADDDYESAFREYVGIKPTGVPTNVSENSAGITIPLVYGGNLKNDRPITVNWEVTGGTYGTDYTVVGASASTGTVSIPAGTTFTEAISSIVIKGVPDFKNEPDVPLTFTLKSADDGVQVGYPMQVSYSFVIADDDCVFEFTGNLVGDDGDFSPADIEAPADVDVVMNSDTEYVFTGLGAGILENSDLWAETVTTAYPVTFDIAPGGSITIAEQHAFTTEYDGDPYEYFIKGTGQVNYCLGTITVSYDIYYTDKHQYLAAVFSGADYMTTELFVATLKKPDEE